MKENYRKYAAVVEELRTRRYLAGVTQKQLGEAIGYARHTIRDIETLRREPKAVILRKIATYFSLPEDYFINLISKEGKTAEGVSSDAKEQICSLIEQVEQTAKNRRHFGYCSAIESLKELMTLKDEALERIFSAIEDALANPNNIKGCEIHFKDYDPCSGYNPCSDCHE